MQLILEDVFAETLRPRKWFLSVTSIGEGKTIFRLASVGIFQTTRTGLGECSHQLVLMAMY